LPADDVETEVVAVVDEGVVVVIVAITFHIAQQTQVDSSQQ